MGLKNNGVFIALNLVFLVYFLELIKVVFDLRGRAFLGELLILGIFILAALVLMFSLYLYIDWAFLGFLVLFAVNLVNTLFIYYNYQFKLTTAVVLVGLGILGLIISIVNINFKRRESDLNEDSNDFDKHIPEDVKIIPEEEFELDEKKPKKKVKKTKKK